MRFGGHGLFSLLLFLVCGALIGGIIGQVLSQVSLSGMIPYLTKTYEIFDFKDIYLNLAVIDVHFGIRFAPNLISIFGILLGCIASASGQPIKCHLLFESPLCESDKLFAA